MKPQSLMLDIFLIICDIHDLPPSFDSLDALFKGKPLPKIPFFPLINPVNCSFIQIPGIISYGIHGLVCERLFIGNHGISPQLRTNSWPWIDSIRFASVRGSALRSTNTDSIEKLLRLGWAWTLRAEEKRMSLLHYPLGKCDIAMVNGHYFSQEIIYKWVFTSMTMLNYQTVRG